MCLSQPVVFFCHFCTFTSHTLNEHILHRTNHRHINQKKFYCGMQRCDKLFNSENLLRLHILRSHAIKVSELRTGKLPPAANNFGQYRCSVGVCRQTFEVYKKFLGHLNFHLSLNTVVKCPYYGCLKLYSNKRSFSSHLSRNHSSKRVVRHEYAHADVVIEDDGHNQEIATDSEEFIAHDYTTNEELTVPVPEENEALILKNLALFCMKLEYHHIIPEKVIQYVFEEMNRVYSQSHSFLNEELRRQMKLHDIPDDKIQIILSRVFRKDPLSKALGKELSTTHMRKEFYKRTFSFVKPEKISYARTAKVKGQEITKQCFFYYVPVKETLLACFVDKSLNLKLERVQVRHDDLLSDVTDGLIFINSKFIQENPISISIVIYQDGVEIVNPIGPGKKKHKILAIYLSILNLPDHLRSHLSSIKLVALCKEKDFVHGVVYGRIVKDLKDLESHGLHIDGYGIVKVVVVYIAGDNLGSHALGGFVENFSKANYFCRFCLLDRSTFSSTHGESVVFPLRTVDSYKECVRLGCSKKSGHKGVKFDSVFNQLKFFHTCNPGLPSCLGHDLMEGCIAYDLKLFIDYLIAESWFTLHELNEAISNFNYSKEEKKDQPLPIQEDAKRIKGGAWQIWNLLRLFPLIVQEFIIDDCDEVWQALLNLSEITEIVCSPSIHKSNLPYLQEIIGNYLTLRKTLFPEVRLRPKHHYLTHYPWLILLFGPLMKVWTLRFESKHTYFKRNARVIRNFKNILYSFAMKHELLQCYIRSGADFRCEVEAFGTNQLVISCYSKPIQNAIRVAAFNICDVQECLRITVKGTEYGKGDIVVLSQDSYECNLQLGRIILILYDCSNNVVYFVCEQLHTVYRPRQRLYVIGESTGYCCIRQDELLSYYPSQSHPVNGNQLVKLKHAIVCTNI